MQGGGASRFPLRGWRVDRGWSGVSVLLFAILLGVLFTTPLAAQMSDVSISASEGIDDAVVTVTASVSCDLPIDGFSFGVSHVPAELELISVTPGAALVPARGGTDPEFISLNVTPVGGPGAVIGCVVDFELAIRLDPLITHDAVDLEYRVIPGPPGDSTVSFTTALGAPPIEVLVLSDITEMVPTQTSGVVTRLGPDCDGNGIADLTEISQGTAFDCDGNGQLDSCDLDLGLLDDCDNDGVPDSCAVLAGTVPDCNGNGIPDSCDLASGTVADCDADGVIDVCATAAGTAADTNANGIPDPCENEFLRGDVNADGSVSIVDPIAVLDYLFSGGPTPTCLRAADFFNDGSVNLSDAIQLLSYLFIMGPDPAAPFPACGPPPALESPLLCESFTACP